MRTIVLTDIHGCYKQLLQLLKRIQFSRKKDKIIFLGDLMDRGENSYSCYEYFLKLKEELKENCILIMGNHEDMLIRSAKGTFSDTRLWMYNGAESTLSSFEKFGKSWQDCVKFIEENFINYYKDENGILFSHAGLFDKDRINDVESLIWNRTVSEGFTYYDGLQIIGHTPTKEPYFIEGEEDIFVEVKPVLLEYGKRKKLPKKGVINIDTACVFGYWLTAMCIYDDGTYKLFKSENI